MPNGEGRIGIYVHIPFCSSICNYCNFNRGLFDADLKERYITALLAEIRGSKETGGSKDPPYTIDPNAVGRVFRPADGAAADTIFFGGGTPSLLEPNEIAPIIGSLREKFDLDQAAEITLETNPETIDRAKLERFRAA